AVGSRAGRLPRRPRTIPPVTEVSVIVPTLNGAPLLAVSLAALDRQTFRSFEVVVVDDGSTDGTEGLLRTSYPEAQIVWQERPLGFARAVNNRIRAAQKNVIVLLNNDTEAEPTWLEELCRALASDPDASCAASKLLLYDRRTVLHSAGDFFGRDG